MKEEKKEIMIVVIMDLYTAFGTVDHDILLTILNKQFGIRVRIGKDYSQPQELHFSVPQGSCSGANVFTWYCSLIDQVAPRDITLNGFSDDHSLRKSFLAGSRTQEQQTKHIMELTFNNIKEWMDSVHSVHLKPGTTSSWT